MKTKMILGFIWVTCLLSAQKQPVEVELVHPNSFSMIVLPDPQSYNKFDVNQPLFELMTAWIGNNIERLRVKAVLCTGDLVEQNEIRIPHGINGNQTSEEQWQAASRGFARLDHKVPYVVCTGNHDYGYEKAENRMTNFPRYFPSERNSCWRKTLVAVGRNQDGIPTLENAAYEFETGTWGKLLVVSIEFAPREEMLDWANSVIQSPTYKNHKVFILTHSYMETDGEIIEKEGYKLSPATYGKTIWERVIYPNENVCFVLCGHACVVGSHKENVSFRTDRNSAGKLVPQMMFNAQTAGGGWYGNGGDGWLRIFEFMPDGKTIKVRTFSPLFAISPVTAQYAWRTETFDQFDIVIE
ncbi:MAG: metallophosphoesterase [Tannerellaceae bacterium]|nr:metallophosphoesterase [Tannerellaceae bacterium]